MNDVILHQKVHKIGHVVRHETDQKCDNICHQYLLCSSGVCLGVDSFSVLSQAPDGLSGAEGHGCHAAKEGGLQGAEQACIFPRALGEVMEAG